jgi:hypothetical protein
LQLVSHQASYPVVDPESDLDSGRIEADHSDEGATSYSVPSLVLVLVRVLVLVIVKLTNPSSP